MTVGCGHSSNSKLTIACAANVLPAMEELVTTFEEQNQTECLIVSGPSGMLTAQIFEGAPYDVFVSADVDYPNRLWTEDLTTEAPEIYATGKLILWSVNLDREISFADLRSETVRHIAIPNPEIAPYGKAVQEMLLNLYLWDELQAKLVMGESVSQTNQFILSGAADFGISAMSAVSSPNSEVAGRWIVCDEKNYRPIDQGLVVLSNRMEHLKEAEAFRDFLLSEQGKDILASYGYDVH
jgi:molybdate transport system substrate-binding protein